MSYHFPFFCSWARDETQPIKERNLSTLRCKGNHSHWNSPLYSVSVLRLNGQRKFVHSGKCHFYNEPNTRDRMWERLLERYRVMFTFFTRKNIWTVSLHCWWSFLQKLRVRYTYKTLSCFYLCLIHNLFTYFDTHLQIRICCYFSIIF